MKSTAKLFVAFVLGASLFSGSQALANSRPDFCSVSHDHRSHDRNYYNYYEKDDYYRSGSYSDVRGYDRGYRNSDYRGRDNYRPRSRVVKKRTFDTRYRARIRLVEEIYYTRSGREQRVCTVLARGPEADYVPQRRLKKVANRNCSRYARVQYRTNYYRSQY